MRARVAVASGPGTAPAGQQVVERGRHRVDVGLHGRGLPRTCSGEANSGVPRKVPVSVRWASPPSDLDRPKSPILTRPSACRKQLDGLTSRWMTPSRCASSRPSMTSRMIGDRLGRGKDACRLDQVLERRAGHQLHDDVGSPGFLVGSQHENAARMGDGAGQPAFLAEPLGSRARRRTPAKSASGRRGGRSRFLRFVDGPHAAAAKGMHKSLYLPMCCGGLVMTVDGEEVSPLGARVGISGSNVAVSGTVGFALSSGLPQYAQNEGGAPAISSTRLQCGHTSCIGMACHLAAATFSTRQQRHFRHLPVIRPGSPVISGSQLHSRTPMHSTTSPLRQARATPAPRTSPPRGHAAPATDTKG